MSFNYEGTFHRYIDGYVLGVKPTFLTEYELAEYIISAKEAGADVPVEDLKWAHRELDGYNGINL